MLSIHFGNLSPSVPRLMMGLTVRCTPDPSESRRTPGVCSYRSCECKNSERSGRSTKRAMVLMMIRGAAADYSDALRVVAGTLFLLSLPTVVRVRARKHVQRARSLPIRRISGGVLGDGSRLL